MPGILVGTFRPENSRRILLNAGIFAALTALTLFLTFLGTRERPEFKATARPGLRASLHAALRNRPFLFGIGLFLLTWLAVDVIQAVLLYFLRYYLHMESYSSIIFGVIFVTALLVLPLWDWASRHTNKRTAYILGIAFWAAVQITLVMLGPTTPLPVILALCALAGIGVGAAHILPWAMIPDTVEWDEMQTGQRHEGMFYSLVMLIQKAAVGLALFLVGLALEWSRYVPNAEIQPDSALLAIRAFAGPVPALLLAGGILFALFFPIGRESHRTIREELSRRRQRV